MTVTELIDRAIGAAILAGIQIRTIYSSADFQMQLKGDNTPVTLADTKAHEEILKALESTGLPVLSEEGIHQGFEERKDWNLFWLVDPLDGTKEFIKRNDEFTVNIALIKKNQPVAGVIYAPVTGELYAGISDFGAWKLLNPDENCTFQSMQHSGTKLPEKRTSLEYVVALSRSHMNQETEAYVEELRQKEGAVQLIRKGSSLKICMVAEGTADVYPKIGKTMEWDTAAGHAIIKAAGKNIFLPDLKTELIYNKENLQNPHFIVI
ncbi:MAG TPA: 3'(2'),5'-bisphosphate nucleotidase CysQ [Prolixibacteraceae bacterium]|nr:3'(2'),5'-bisphosphate nucleotidase CysQ [Prolixibacteraceae bacterium]